MCPASAPLHLERYIGSCLISAGLPHHHHHHHHLHHSNNNYPKKDLSSSQTRYRRYPPNLPPVSAAQCHQFNEYCGASNNIVNVGSSPIGGAQAYSRSWTTAGLPLISMSPASPRRGHSAVTVKDKQQQQQQQDERSPLSRLAIHTQGAPLIQAGRQQSRLGNKQNHKQPKKEKEQKDFSSVASDESSGNSENSLPRIIKPRKRRKKDRKPQQTAASVTNSTPSTTVTSSPITTTATVGTISQQQTVNETATIVTLKPYTPLCQDFKTQPDVSSGGAVNPIKIANNEQVNAAITTTIQFRRNNNQVATEFPLEENNIVSNLVNAPCQCRYCDPINLTWDVDQRCYSPYLTPPPSNYSSSSLLSSASSQDWGFDDSRSSSSGDGSSLEVSSEIITSPNGHRDIEIKFFSTSPPAAKSTATPIRPISVTPPWPN